MTDASNCVVVSPVVTVGTPTQINAVAQAYPTSCFGICDGSVDVDPSGGTPNYLFSWTSLPGGAGVGATDSLSGRCPGQYQIIVEDANGCFSTPVVVEVLDALPITLALNGTNPTCYDACDGIIDAVAGGGAGNFSYVWSPNPPAGQGTDQIFNLCGEIQYDVVVTDDNSCTETDNLTLISPPSYDITTSQNDLDCFGDTDGSITATANSGGDGGPYTYTWIPGGVTGQGTPTITNLTGGKL